MCVAGKMAVIEELPAEESSFLSSSSAPQPPAPAASAASASASAASSSSSSSQSSSLPSTPPQLSPPLVARRLEVREEAAALERKPRAAQYVLRRFFRNPCKTGVLELQLSPSGSVNVSILMFFAFGVGCALLGFSLVGLLVLLPLGVYTAMWHLYPMVEPSDGLHSAVEVMSKHPFLRRAQLEGLETLFQLSRSSANKGSLVDGGAVGCALEAAFAFEQDLDILARAIAVLGHLALEPGVSASLLEDGAMALCAQWLAPAGLVSESVARHTLVLLVSLLQCEDEAVQGAARADALCALAIVRHVCRAMDAHVTISRVQQWGCVALFNLAADARDGPRMLVRDGAAEQLAKAMLNQPSTETVQSVAVAALARCICRGEGNRDHAATKRALLDGHSAVFEAVDRARIKFPNNEQLQLGAWKIIQECREAFPSSRAAKEADEAPVGEPAENKPAALAGAAKHTEAGEARAAAREPQSTPRPA